MVNENLFKNNIFDWKLKSTYIDQNLGFNSKFSERKMQDSIIRYYKVETFIKGIRLEAYR